MTTLKSCLVTISPGFPATLSLQVQSFNGNTLWWPVPCSSR